MMSAASPMPDAHRQRFDRFTDLDNLAGKLGDGR